MFSVLRTLLAKRQGRLDDEQGVEDSADQPSDHS